MDAFDPGLAPRAALWETIVTVTRRAIILGELQPGLHLEEPAFAEKFGVSRIPVREALTHLAHEGLVRLEPRRGAFVIGVTPDDVHDIYDLRLLIELHAVRRAAERAQPSELILLQAHADQMAEAVRLNNLNQVAEPDVKFHHQIVVMAGNQRLLAAWDPLGGLIETFLSITNTTYRDMPQTVLSHQRIIDCLRMRDADTAVEELRRHLGNGEAVMKRVLAIPQSMHALNRDGNGTKGGHLAGS